MQDLLQDLRYALRMVRKNPGFTGAVAFTVAVGIGAATTIFGLVNAFFLRPLPGINAERLVNVHAAEPGGESFLGLSYPTYRDLRDGNEVFEGLAAFTDQGFSLRTGAGEAELIGGMIVSGNYFSVLGVRPTRGRFFLSEEDRTPGSHPVAVVSHRLWKRRLGSDPSAVGRRIHLNGHPFTIIGIAPEGFSGHFVAFPFEVWVPTMMAAQVAPQESLIARNEEWLELIGRRKPDVSLPQARLGLNSLAKRFDREYPDEWGKKVFNLQPATGLDDSLRGGVIGFVAVLSAVALLLLLIASVNVGGMLLARGVSRQREVAIRQALGSSRGRLLRQLLLENLLLFLLGGAVGTALAYWCADLLRGFNPPFAVPLILEIAPDLRVLFFALLISVAAGAAFGLFPALQTSRPDLVPALKGEGTGRGARGARLRGALVVGQVAMSLVLLVVAGLFLRTVREAAKISPGFEPDGLYLTDVSLGLLGHDDTRGLAFYRRLVERVRALPGVSAVTVARRVPLGLGSLTTRVGLEGQTPPSGEKGFSTDMNTVGPDYFETMRIPIVAGRAFQTSDREDAAPVAIINETFSRRFWPGADPIGKEISLGQKRLRIIGVARNGKYRRLWEEPRLHVYFPHAQNYSANMQLILRMNGNRDVALAALSREIRALDENLPVTQAIAVKERIGISLTPQRVAAAVAGTLGVTGLLLAGIGLYGVIAFSVSQRTREIGIRAALGAQKRDVLALVLRQGALLAAAGLGLGVAVSLLATRFLASMLYGVRAHDPATFLLVGLLLMGVALLASYLPARRAARVDPMVALRQQ